MKTSEGKKLSEGDRGREGQRRQLSWSNGSVHAYLILFVPGKLNSSFLTSENIPLPSAEKRGALTKATPATQVPIRLPSPFGTGRKGVCPLGIHISEAPSGIQEGELRHVT